MALADLPAAARDGALAAGRRWPRPAASSWWWTGPATGGPAGTPRSRDKVLEDVELARAVKRAGGRIALADGSRLATCRMYDDWPQLRDGYTKSLWAAFGRPGAAAAVVAALLLLYTAPPLIALAGSPADAPGVAAGGARRRTCSGWPDGWSPPARPAAGGGPTRSHTPCRSWSSAG